MSVKTKLTLSIEKDVIIKAKQKCLEIEKDLSEVVQKCLEFFIEG